jgi:hypothetical protein
VEKWVHCVVFDRTSQFFRRLSYEAASEYGLMVTVHFWSTFGAGGVFESNPELGAAYRMRRTEAFHLDFDMPAQLSFGPMGLSLLAWRRSRRRKRLRSTTILPRTTTLA